jgi:hypothetical protein
MGSNPSVAPVPKRLAPLVRRLAALSPEQRRAVMEAASREPSRATISWEAIEDAVGAVELGGDAVRDTAQLYDG